MSSRIFFVIDRSLLNDESTEGRTRERPLLPGAPIPDPAGEAVVNAGCCCIHPSTVMEVRFDPKNERMQRFIVERTDHALHAASGAALLLFSCYPRLIHYHSAMPTPQLAVLLHAYRQSPARMGAVRKAVEGAFPGVEIFAPKLPLQMFSFADLSELARGLLEQIDEKVEQAAAAGRAYSNIIFAGHSMSGLLARKIYILACGETEKARFGHSDGEALQPPKKWREKISRIVLLAGVNRGWTISHHMKIGRAIGITLGVAVGNALSMVRRKTLLIFQTRRGAPFITQLRLQWIAMEQKAACEGSKTATVVQLLGSVDDLVSPEDNIDLVTGRGFIYLDVPKSGHENVIEMGDEVAEGPARKEVFLKALTWTEDELDKDHLLPSDEKPRASDSKVSDVIFVIHGIRDTGHWTQKIARCVARRGRGNSPPKMYSSETSSYGYFAMMPFLLPWRRREKVEWLMDQYVEAQALYPDAKFSFVGHSNGTYLLAKALEEYRSCRFENVVFAGSVVRRNYDWIKAVERGQVKAVLNYVATTDAVVACFPGAIEMLKFQDLGSAGHNGFKQFTQECERDFHLYERGYVRGWHSAALKEENWEDIAHFIINGEPKPATLAGRRSRWVVAIGWIAPVVWVGIVCVLYWGGSRIWRLDWSEGMRTLAMAAYLWCIWKILTKI